MFMCRIFPCKIYVFCTIFFHFTPEFAGLQLLVPPTKEPELIDLNLSKKEADFISKTLKKCQKLIPAIEIFAIANEILIRIATS